MPRFENEGYNPDRRRDVDRTVPDDENYYGYRQIDLNFNNRENPIKDNQNRRGVNPCDDVPPPIRRTAAYRSETPEDFRKSERRSAPQPQRSHNPQKMDKVKNAGKAKLKAKPKLIISAVIAVILAIVIALTGTLLAVMGRVNYHDKKENTYVDEASLYSKTGVKNVLLLGVDARSGQSGEETRSDTMMLVTLDSIHHTIKLTSFLRDTWVYVPTLGYNQRLNAACSSGGYQGVVDAIEYNFGVDIDGYAVVDFEMFKVLVDSIGGVEVEVSEAEAKEVTNHPNVYGDVVLDSGKYKLTGEQALAYCRIRKIDTDFVRTERQRTVMSAILSDIKSANPIKLMNMAYKSAEFIETDLSKSEIFSLATTAVSCLSGDMAQEKVPFDNTWSYANIQGNSVISIDTEENKQMLIDYIYETEE